MFVTFFIIGVVSWIYALIHFIRTFNNIEQGKRMYVTMNPIGIFINKYFTEEGIIYRVKMFKGLLLFIISCMGAGLCIYFIK